MSTADDALNANPLQALRAILPQQYDARRWDALGGLFEDETALALEVTAALCGEIDRFLIEHNLGDEAKAAQNFAATYHSGASVPKRDTPLRKFVDSTSGDYVNAMLLQAGDLWVERNDVDRLRERIGELREVMSGVTDDNGALAAYLENALRDLERIVEASINCAHWLGPGDLVRPRSSALIDIGLTLALTGRSEDAYKAWELAETLLGMIPGVGTVTSVISVLRSRVDEVGVGQKMNGLADRFKGGSDGIPAIEAGAWSLSEDEDDRDRTGESA